MPLAASIRAVTRDGDTLVVVGLVGSAAARVALAPAQSATLVKAPGDPGFMTTGNAIPHGATLRAVKDGREGSAFVWVVGLVGSAAVRLVVIRDLAASGSGQGHGCGGQGGGDQGGELHGGCRLRVEKVWD